MIPNWYTLPKSVLTGIVTTVINGHLLNLNQGQRGIPVKLRIPVPPKVNGRIVMIPVSGWWDGFTPTDVLKANNEENYIESRANEKVWVNLRKGMEWRISTLHDAVHHDYYCPLCGALLVKTETDGLWCQNGCYPSEYELWLALQEEVNIPWITR